MWRRPRKPNRQPAPRAGLADRKAEFIYVFFNLLILRSAQDTRVVEAELLEGNLEVLVISALVNWVGAREHLCTLVIFGKVIMGAD